MDSHLCTNIKNSEYDQEIPQSQTATNPWHREEEPHSNHETSGRQTKRSNQLSLPHQDDCKARRDITKRATKQNNYRIYESMKSAQGQFFFSLKNTMQLPFCISNEDMPIFVVI